MYEYQNSARTSFLGFALATSLVSDLVSYLSLPFDLFLTAIYLLIVIPTRLPHSPLNRGICCWVYVPSRLLHRHDISCQLLPVVSLCS